MLVRIKKILERQKYLNLLGSTFGQIGIASFLICVISGVFLTFPFDVSKPYNSIANVLLTNKPAVLFRNFHYWSAQLFLIFTFLHFWDHLRLSTETKVKKGVWLRLTISIFVIVFVMLSGFLLKADADSLQARKILETLLTEIPFFGNTLAYSLLGNEKNYDLIYVNHIATATIFILFIIIEHSKIIWPKAKLSFQLILAILLLSILFPATLNNLTSSIVKGPWYFLGLQELFHYLSYPQIATIIIVLILVCVYLIWYLKKKSKTMKIVLLAITVIYSILIIIGYFFRGENWKLTLPWNNKYFSDNTFTPIENIKDYFITIPPDKKISEILGRPEGCLNCHSNFTGFTKSHNPEAIGCVSCHKGNPFSVDKNLAHNNMLLIPGNLTDANSTCGTVNCHPGIHERVEKSLMNTASGLISVDKFAFNELPQPEGLFNAANVKYSASETHLRQLCLSCHIGNPKTELGEITQKSRGGGCLSCHLNYTDKAKKDLTNLLQDKNSYYDSTLFHPQISIDVSSKHCFGCHSRSGRISTNYEGWHETLLEPAEVKDSVKYKILEDERVFKFVKEDVHHLKGMDCVDCHTSYGVMGDGKNYTHEEQQEIVLCIDCHNTVDKIKKISVDKIDSESKKIMDLRELTKFGKEVLVTSNGNRPLVNTFYNKKGNFLITKKAKIKLPLKPPLQFCIRDKAHKRLDCASCHSSWSPQCLGCHTDFNPNAKAYDHLTKTYSNGKWTEYTGDFFAEPPVLGIMKNSKTGDEKITTFIPGMIMTLDKSAFTGEKKDSLIFKRLYAPTFSHTIVKDSRTCQSCHNNPLALGYGRGELKYVITKGKGKWIFTSTYQKSEYDGLPEDAWIGFLEVPKDNRSTRTYTRPFSLSEQKKILKVGICLTCHKSNSKIMKTSLNDFDNLLKNLSPKCILSD